MSDRNPYNYLISRDGSVHLRNERGTGPTGETIGWLVKRASKWDAVRPGGAVVGTARVRMDALRALLSHIFG